VDEKGGNWNLNKLPGLGTWSRRRRRRRRRRLAGYLANFVIEGPSLHDSTSSERKRENERARERRRVALYSSKASSLSPLPS